MHGMARPLSTRNVSRLSSAKIDNLGPRLCLGPQLSPCGRAITLQRAQAEPGHEEHLDSSFRWNDERGRAVIPGKAAGRDPESRESSECFSQVLVMHPCSLDTSHQVRGEGRLLTRPGH